MRTLSPSLNIGVIRGGPSSEYDVSLKTGANVLKTLSLTHRPLDIFISNDGKWHVQGIERSPERILKNIDVVFNALHGKYGEDGGVQEILDHHGVLYTGSNRLSSAFAMNKVATKERLKAVGVKTPVYMAIRRSDSLMEKAKEIFNSIPHPLIAKPANGGSSHGVYKADSFSELLTALENILADFDVAIVEEYIPGKEATCGVINNFREKNIYVLPTVEIIPSSGDFFDEDSKYNGKSKEICPGNFSSKEKKEIEKLAADVHGALGLRHYSRSDFIVTPRRGIYFLEVNSLPGLTNESLFPKALNAVGVEVKDFLHHVINLALHKK